MWLDCALSKGLTDELRNCRATAEFLPVLRRACAALGFDHFTMAFRSPVLNGPSRFLTLTSYPEALCRRYDEAGFLVVDPVVKRAAESHGPFTWNELDWAESDKSREMRASFIAAGLDFGLSVPLRGANHQVALFSLAGRDGPVADEALSGLIDRVRIVACRIFDRLVELPEMGCSRRDFDRLTDRETEFLRLSAMGYPLKTIHAVMNIKQSTATYFTNRIVKKLGAKRLRMAIIQAQLNGVIDLVGYPERNVGTQGWLHESAFLDRPLPPPLPAPVSLFLPARRP